jgi:DNA polymerase-3 subunit epsilon
MRITPALLPILAARVVVFDTETTGGTACNEICQIGAVEFMGGTLARTMAVYVRPTCPMNPWAEAVHGLSEEFLCEHGIAPEEAMRRFFEFVAHNAAFDLRMLRQECAKFDLCFTCDGIETCDTLALSRRLRKDLPNHKLATLVDAIACAGVLFKLLETQP